MKILNDIACTLNLIETQLNSIKFNNWIEMKKNGMQIGGKDIDNDTSMKKIIPCFFIFKWVKLISSWNLVRQNIMGPYSHPT
jgi:tRNA splicing ligase